MRYKKFLQRAGLVLILLVVGVVAGLMAPQSSGAGRPKVTLQIDGIKHVLNVGIAGGCAILSGENGFYTCYAITNPSSQTFTGGSSRLFGIRAIGTGIPAPRILIGDTSSGDNFRITNLEVFPTTTTFTETHYLRIYVDIVMDGASATVTCNV